VTNDAPLSRSEAEDFLYEEAAALDRWDLDSWLGLFDEDSESQVPSTDLPDGDPEASQYLVADNYELLAARVQRLKSKYAHAENPRSRTVRLITNVRVAEYIDPTTRVHANFQIWRMRDGRDDPYIGRYDHLVFRASGGLKFRRRRAILGPHEIRPGGRLSFIL
jgi:p-cumate 2,3-dioxygenase beta subunit